MTITFFFVSLFVLCTLILSKIFERKVRKIHLLSKLSAKGDEKIHKLIDILIFKYNRYKKISRIFIFEFLPSYAYEILVKMKDHVSKKYYSAGDEFRGKRVLRSSGSVSFFLERLADDKTATKAQKI